MRWLIVVVLAGCSFAGVRPPSRSARAVDLECSNTLPVIDTAAALLAVGAATALTIDAKTCTFGHAGYGDSGCLAKDMAANYVGIPLFIYGGIEALSAVHGHLITRSCRATRRERLGLNPIVTAL